MGTVPVSPKPVADKAADRIVAALPVADSEDNHRAALGTVPMRGQSPQSFFRHCLASRT